MIKKVNKNAFWKYPLAPNQICQGIEACLNNGDNLYEASIILASHGKKDVAKSLLIIAHEELGKIPMLLNAATIEPKYQDKWLHFWKDFRDHNEKQIGSYAAAIAYDAAVYNEPEKMKTKLDEVKKFVKNFSKVKEEGFYVNYLPLEKIFLAPNQISSDSFERLLPSVCDLILTYRFYNSNGLFSPRSIVNRREIFSRICTKSDDFLMIAENIWALISPFDKTDLPVERQAKVAALIVSGEPQTRKLKEFLISEGYISQEILDELKNEKGAGKKQRKRSQNGNF